MYWSTRYRLSALSLSGKETCARIDTTAIYSYTYSGLRIIAYSEDKRGVIINHILNYDTQNRLLKDTIINPSLTNNKTTYFEYLPDTIIQTNIFSNAVLSAFSKDTIILIGNTISKEFIRTHNSNGTSSDQEFTYTASSFRNPLNYVNNNVLFASDYKNESGFYTFSIYNPQNIMPVLATQVVTKSWNNSLPPTQFTAYLASTLDSLGRVHSIIELNNRNRTSIYLYY